MWVQWVKQYHGPKSRSGHVYQDIAWTRSWGLVLYEGCIRIIKSARPAEGGPAEGGGLSTSNLPLIDTPSGTNAWWPSKGRGSMTHLKSILWVSIFYMLCTALHKILFANHWFEFPKIPKSLSHKCLKR